MTQHSESPTPVEPLLPNINSPADVRTLSREQLEQLSEELREFILHSVAQTGGHLSSNLGTVELTVALHHVFDTPIKVMAIKSSQGDVKRCRGCANWMVFLVFQNVLSPNTIPSVQGIHRPVFQPRLVWRWRRANWA